jgi:competence protein ComEC
MKKKNYLEIIIFCLFTLDVFIWSHILFVKNVSGETLYFFEVGQGDSQMISLDNVQILIDGGPNSKILNELPKALSIGDRYIDLIILSHPQLDHFGGLIDVLKNYKIGMFISNGLKGTSGAYQELENLIAQNKIKYLVLSEGDRIKYKDYILDVLAPSDKNLASKEVNDTGLVLKFSSPKLKALYTADIGFDVEKELSKKYNLKADLLKVAHHGSKYSSSKEFLSAVNSKISLIQVGQNSYGHPTKEVLDRLAFIGSAVYRTDINGTIKLNFANNFLNILTSR